jgi:hypothetical protein
MKATHFEMIHAQCPVDPTATDYYTVEFETKNLVTVEAIREALSECRGRSFFQEDLTQLLAARSNCTVTTEGMHGTTKTRVTASP